MPELPEMETYRTLLCSTVIGRTIVDAAVNREKTINVSVAEFLHRVRLTRIEQVTRRAKHLLFWLDSGDVLLLHLMLGGWLYRGRTDDVPRHSSQVVLTLDDGQILYFLGLRLGFLHVGTAAEVTARLQGLGPDPLDPAFTTATLRAALQAKRGPLKMALVDQHVLSGIGNCYADEVCFEAGILPLRRIPDLHLDDYARMHQAMSNVLTRAIAYGGYMDHPFTANDERTGGYNAHCLVYDRGDEPCPRCGCAIIRTEHTRRKVFYCANCQH